jgi:2,4-dienoyl-CoA reductase-like NADH-dependent reductase (Old Yellow Enzyme family)
VIDDNGGLEQLRAWAKAGTENGNHLWMQISHPGRQSTRMSTRQPMSPSGVQLNLAGMFARPRPMTTDDIQDAIARYARVAGVAKETGFTGVQVHGAHGYLISQFLSPVTNQRPDAWGGSLENRARFLLEAVRAVRREVGAEYPISVKLNSADFQKGGFTLDECVTVAGWLGDEGIDLLEISGGTYEQPRLLGHEGRAEAAEPVRRETTKKREAYFLEYARAIRDSARIPLMVTGGFRTRAAMASALEADETDVIGLARPLCVYPDLPKGLIDGTIERTESWENGLRLGPGRLLGPASPIFLFKFLNLQGEIAWFYRQIVLLSRGYGPDTRLGLRRGLIQHVTNELKLARQRKYHPPN